MVMEDERVTTADLLEAWRKATRAAQLAARLATEAGEAVEAADAARDRYHDATRRVPAGNGES
jgi:hypothetical protein